MPFTNLHSNQVGYNTTIAMFGRIHDEARLPKQVPRYSSNLCKTSKLRSRPQRIYLTTIPDNFKHSNLFLRISRFFKQRSSSFSFCTKFKIFVLSSFIFFFSKFPLLSSSANLARDKRQSNNDAE